MKNRYANLVLFDIDGTLLTSGGAGKQAFVVACREVLGIDDLLRDIPFAGRTDPAILSSILGKHGVTEDPDVRRRFFAAYLDSVRTLIGTGECRLHAGIGELLERLRKRRDTMTGLLTGNLEEGAWIKLRRLEVDDAFAVGGFGSDARERAEVARIARNRAEAMAGHPFADHRVFVIGDTPEDIRCARAIRAVAVAVATGGAERDELAACRPDLLFDDLSEPAALIQRLDGASPPPADAA